MGYTVGHRRNLCNNMYTVRYEGNLYNIGYNILCEVETVRFLVR